MRLSAIVDEHFRLEFLTLVFCMMRCRGESISATSEVEKSISIMAMLPSSLLNIREKGSVWYIRNPLEVPRTSHHPQLAWLFPSRMDSNSK